MKMPCLKTLHRVPSCAAAGATWAFLHQQAIICPRDGFELAIVEMLQGWLRYADTVQAAWDAGIGKDYVLAPHWAQIGSGLRGLLNGDLGRLDGGTLDGILCRALNQEGFDPDTL